MARGRKNKDRKKNDKPKTPESSQSSAPSVTDDTKQLLPEARGATSSHQARNEERKSKSVASEPSSTPPSSEQSAVGDDVSLLQSGARASSKDSKKAVAGTGSPRKGLLNIFSRSSPESTRGKSRLAVPDQGSGGSRTPSLSPSKNTSGLSQFAKSIATKFSPKKSPKRSMGSESQKESTSRQKTEFADTKQKSLKESSGNTSEATLKGDGQNTGSSNSSGSSGRVSSDVPQSENRLTVPGPRSTASNQRSPKSFMEQLIDKISPERKDKVHSKDSSSTSSNKSGSSSSVISNISKQRQESNASNISSENSRSSNSKSSSISCANNESLHPDNMHSCEKNSGDSVDNTNCGSRQSKEVWFKTMKRNLIETHKSGLNNQPVTQRLDNIYFTEKSRHRSRSFRCDVLVDKEKLSSPKDDAKARQEDGGDNESQKRATGARSAVPIGNNSPGIGSNEIGVDIQGAAASWSDSSVRRKDTAMHRGDNAQSGEDRSDQSVRRKNTLAWGNVDAPSGVEADKSDEYVRKDTATHRGANAPSECRPDQSVRRKNTPARRNVNAPSGVEADWLDKSIGKDAAQQSGAEARLSDRFSRMDIKPRRDDSLEVEAILKTPLAVGPSTTSARHPSLSPRCGHEYIHTPHCSKTTKTKLTQRRIIRERRNQRKCRQQTSFNATFIAVGERSDAVRSNLRVTREILPELQKHVNATVRNLKSSKVDIKNFKSSLKVIEESPSRVEIKNPRPSLETIDEYSSRLKVVRKFFKELREKIKVMIELLDSSRLDIITREFTTYDKGVVEFVNEIDADRLAVPGSNFLRLRKILQELRLFEIQLEDIQINVGFPRLELELKKVLTILSDINEIQRTTDLRSIRLVLYEVWDIWHILQRLLKKID